MSLAILVGVAWPYANGPLHLGHLAGCFLPADIFARYHRMAGNRVLMVSGSDCHGTPITVRAQQEGTSPAEVARRFHESFLDCWRRLGIRWELYTTTMTDNHTRVVQDMFLQLHGKGYIYPAPQEMLYCPAEERFLPDRYVEGKCPHCGYTGARGDQCDQCGRTLNATDLVEPRCKFCGATPVVRETEHFFFKWSAFTESLSQWVADKHHWRPNVLHFTRRYLAEGLKDSAITRDIEWGIPVPLKGYEHKRIYVWWEAVIGYYSASIEWATRQGQPDLWRDWWQDPQARSYYFIGKDNIPFHTIRWPAVLMGVGGLNLPYDVPANEYLNLEGEAFSTSRNWAVWVHDFLDRYDPDPLRYYLTANMPEAADADFSWHEFVRKNNDELVAAWGNLVHRTMTFTHKHFGGRVPAAEERPEDREILERVDRAFPQVGALLEACRFKAALGEVMELCREGNRYFDYQAPWKAVKEDRTRAGTIMATTLRFIAGLRVLLTPFLPTSCQALYRMLGYSGDWEAGPWARPLLAEGQALGTPEPLFRKLDESVVEEERRRLGAK
jgi:methionyl-tRNA synthetase